MADVDPPRAVGHPPGSGEFGDGSPTPRFDVPEPPTATMRQSVAYLGGVNAAAFAGGFVRQKVFAVVLGPVGIGALSLATAFLELLLNACRLGAPTGLLREVSGAVASGERGRAARVFVDLQRVAWLIGIGVLAVGSLMARPLSEAVFKGVLPPWTLLVILLAVPLSLSGQLAQAMINAVGTIPRLAGTKVTVTGLGLVVSLTAVVFFGLNGAVVQLAVAAGVSAAVSHVSLRRVFVPSAEAPSRVPGHIARRSVRGAYRIGGAEAIGHVAIAVNLLLFRSILVGRLGLVDNGFYQAAMGLSRQYTIALSGAVFVYLYPRLSAAAAKGVRGIEDEVRSSLRYILALAVPVALLLLGSRDVVVPLLLSREFTPVVPLIGFSATADLLALTIALFQITLLALGRVRAFTVLTVARELLYLVAFVAGVSVFGLAGAVAAYLVWGLVMTPVWVWAIGLRGPWAGLGDGGRWLLVGLVLAGSTALLPVGNPWVRLWVLAAVLGWVALHRRTLLRSPVQ